MRVHVYIVIYAYMCMCMYMYTYNIHTILLKYFYLCSKDYKINKKLKLRLIVIHPSSTSNPVVEVHLTCNLCTKH